MLMEEERKQIVEYGKKMSASGLSVGTSGNISIYDPETGYMCISPSGLGYFDTTPEDVVVMDLDGNIVDGKRKPSSEHGLHTVVYKNRPEARAVVHTHSPYATTLACMHETLKPIHYVIMGSAVDEVPLVPYVTFGTPELADAVEGPRRQPQDSCRAARKPRRRVLPGEPSEGVRPCHQHRVHRPDSVAMHGGGRAGEPDRRQMALASWSALRPTASRRKVAPRRRPGSQRRPSAPSVEAMRAPAVRTREVRFEYENSEARRRQDLLRRGAVNSLAELPAERKRAYIVMSGKIQEELGQLKVVTDVLEGAGWTWRANTDVEPEPCWGPCAAASPRCSSSSPTG